MNGSTKILTVSYGTFSCTLEGFDDPLSSMREMAEYFRDLAADDRYFGAEPPTPDVEMLQRIAEKEVKRRVEARVSETGVALVAARVAEKEVRPTSRVEPEAFATEPVESVDDARGPLTYDDDFLMSDEPEDVLSVDPNAKISTDGPAESVAEKLRRIRAVVSRSIEVEDNKSLRAEQAPNAGIATRDRALSETIQAIQADLSYDEEAPLGSDGTKATEQAGDTISADETDMSAFDETASELEAQVDDPPDTDSETVTEDEEDLEDQASNDEMMRQISDVIGKMSQQIDDEDEDFEETDTAEVPRATDRVATRVLSPEPEADVGRLLDETDTKLNEDDTVRRRRVISQMRAAVAATKADRLVSRQVSREVEAEAEKDPYREDLSEAVQEAPVAPRGTATTPLVLVSTQRIDTQPVQDSPEVTTRADTSEGFAKFAESMGAKELSELLEAAAAYTVFAEGQSSFTRPEIMQRVARVDPTVRMSREDSLRSFGQLLRQGKFKKLERGQFTIDETTKFNPEQRFAGE